MLAFKAITQINLCITRLTDRIITTYRIVTTRKYSAVPSANRHTHTRSQTRSGAEHQKPATTRPRDHDNADRRGHRHRRRRRLHRQRRRSHGVRVSALPRVAVQPDGSAAAPARVRPAAQPAVSVLRASLSSQRQHAQTHQQDPQGRCRDDG